MFLCRGARAVVASSCSYYKFAGSVQVATTDIAPWDAVWAWHNSSLISCCQVSVRGTWTNSVHVFRLPSGMLQGTSVESRVSRAWTACQSASGLGFSWPFSCWTKDRMTDDRLNSPKSLFCLGTETCTIRPPPNKLLSSALSTASKQRLSNWTKMKPATDVPKVKWSSPSESY